MGNADPASRSGPPLAAFQEKHWERLLTDVTDRKVVPVVGPELMVLEHEGRTVRMVDRLADLLADRLGQPRCPPDALCPLVARWS